MEMQVIQTVNMKLMKKLTTNQSEQFWFQTSFTPDSWKFKQMKVWQLQSACHFVFHSMQGVSTIKKQT